MKSIIALLFLLLLIPAVYAQEDKKSTTLTPEQQKEVLKQINVDSARILSEFGAFACNCIDTIARTNNKTHNDYNNEIKRCIDSQVSGYNLTIQMMNLLKDQGEKKELTITMISGENSPAYTRSYQDIEEWLFDSCVSLKQLITTNDKTNDKSFSENPDAMEAYNKGVGFLKEEKYAEGLPFFEKAVKIDDQFVFAWDNVGVCNRRLGNYKAAEKAYLKSLEIDPKGPTPLQNLPVVYEFMKEYDKAITAYEYLIKVDAENPEGYFGRGRIYLLYKQDNEKALDDMCKAYNIYAKYNSPYRVDAQNIMSMIFKEMKKLNKEETFFKILADNNINVKKE